MALQRRSTALKRKADKLVREGQELRAGVKDLEAKIAANELDLGEVRQQQRSLEEQARLCAAPDPSDDARTLAERIGTRKAYFMRDEVRAKQAEIEAAFDLVEKLRAGAVAHAAAEHASANMPAADAAAAQGEPDTALEDELMEMAFGSAAASGDGGADEKRNRVADKLRTALAKRVKLQG